MRLGNLRDQRGFTLAELLVACATLSVILAGVYTALGAGMKAAEFGTGKVEAQQSLRFILDGIARDARHGGYDPLGTATFDPVLSPSTSAFTLQYDWNGDGVISTSGTVTGPDGLQHGEQIVYAVSGGNLQRQEIGVDAYAVVLTPVRSATFTYLDATATTTSTGSAVRTIMVSLAVAPSSAAATDASTTATMTERIRLRNR